MEKFYLTTAIPYASRKPHFGNTYEVILTDAIARYRRAMGYDVLFGTGTDEHGQKVENLAASEGVTPKQYVDRVVGEIKEVWDGMNTTYGHFIRTTDDIHEKAVEKIFKRFYDQGDIYKGYYEGWYCTPCEAFFTATQVTDGVCPDCGRPVKQEREEAYFFKMSKYADRLIRHIEDNPDFIVPESNKKEMVNNFLKTEGGLQDLCVSRSTFTWGVKTFDPKHVIYVWVDALSNYITALGYDPEKSFEEQSEHFRKFWPCDVHVIGKDILRFHSIYWPIFLMALDLPLPRKIFVHQWFKFGADKMSKSRGNVIYADELAQHFGVDATRYYALAEMPYASDGSVTYESVIKRYNTDLVNTLGNLVKRTLDMEKKYFGKTVAAPTCREPIDDELETACFEAYDKLVAGMESYHVADALSSVFAAFSRANKYIDETAPWALAKDETKRDRLATVMFELLGAIRYLAVLVSPFLPATAEEILRELGAERELAAIRASRENGTFGDIPYSEFIAGKDRKQQFADGIRVGSEVGDSTVLFARVDEAAKMAEFNAIMEAQAKEAAKEAAKNAPAPVPEKPEGIALIGIDDFMKVELRTAAILSAEPVPKAKKLYKLSVDLGYEKRQVVSGIAKYYKPEELVGKKIVLVANLTPATLCGVQSEGMLLASGEETVRVIFLDPETPLGERIH